MKKELETRKNLLYRLDNILAFMNDETAYSEWQTIGLPDGYTEDDLNMIARDDEEFFYMLKTFAAIFLQYMDAE